jgi:hypothetical protein
MRDVGALSYSYGERRRGWFGWLITAHRINQDTWSISFKASVSEKACYTIILSVAMLSAFRLLPQIISAFLSGYNGSRSK